jgi:choline dehydrogenase
MMALDDFDFIIIGAGSAGCVLADRLSKSGKHRVLILEAGGSDRRLWIRMPLGYGRTFHDARVNWKFETKPVAALGGRTGYWPRGRVVGGSSSINALVYCRGLPQDFETWCASGATGWGWDDVRAHFEKLEHKLSADGVSTGSGPMWVSDVSRQMHPSTLHFLNAARELGYTTTHDMNSDVYEGVGYYHLNTRNGMRCSAADAFLRPALKRKNVMLITCASV